MSALATALAGHARVRAAKSSDGTIYMVNGIDRPMAWDGLAAAVRNMGIDSPTSQPTVATSGAGNLTGDYFYYVAFKNSITGEYSGLSPITAVITAAANQLTVTLVSSTTDTQVDKWVIFRNTAGQTDTFYYVDETGIGTPTINDSYSDEEIEANPVMEDHTVLNGKFPYIVNFKGRMVGYGSRIETTGTATATFGSPTVTGAGTAFRASHRNQRIRFGTESTYYTITGVSSSTQILITPNYAGSTGGGKSFRIYPVRQSDVTWSSANSNEGFAAADSVGVFPNDGDRPSGMAVIGQSLCLFKRAHIYRFQFDGDPNPITGTGQISQAVSNRGIVNNECCVVVGQTGFCLDSSGIYAFDGAATATPMDQAVRRYFNPDDGIAAAEQVSRAYSDSWHGVYDPQANAVVFFVTTGEETKPKTALVYELERQRWTTWKFPMAITASTVEQDASGKFRAWVGDENGCIWALSGTRQLEGASPSSGTVSGTATGGAATTLSDAAASFQMSSSGLRGVPIKIIAGTGAGQERIIESNNPVVVTVSQAWTTVPDATSVYRIGYIESKHRHFWTAFDQGSGGDARKIAVYFDPTTQDRNFEFRLFKDFDADPLTEWMAVGENTEGIVEIPSTAIGESGDGWMKVKTQNRYGRAEQELHANLDTVVAVEFRQVDSKAPVLIRGFDLVGFADAIPRYQVNP
jgi:hypothetical protein